MGKTKEIGNVLRFYKLMKIKIFSINYTAVNNKTGSPDTTNVT